MSAEKTPLQKFFFKHIKIIKSERKVCEECGDRLQGDFSEVCHILNKSKFKSIAMEDDNVIYLCGWKSNNNCHAMLDNSALEYVKRMKIYPKLQAAFKGLEDRITEKMSWKDWDRWE